MTHVCYDISRLLTRLLRSTPNGIDRVDYMFASHFLNSQADVSAAIVTGGRPLVIRSDFAAAALAAVEARWRENDVFAEDDPELSRIIAFLSGQYIARTAPTPPQRAKVSPLRQLARRVFKEGLRARSNRLAKKSVYLNVSQFPLWVRPPFRWLGNRPDISAVFFIHDLLPLSFPDFFPSGELERHKSRLQNFARFAAGGIVSTPAVAEDLRHHLRGLGRTDCPIHIAPPPVAPIFQQACHFGPLTSERPFFVMCSTIEPRKNHLMILNVWLRLVERLGNEAPLLILVGKRGWKFSPSVGLLKSSAALGRHVIESNGLSTPALKVLLDQARALLMPTFGEGYGLPVYEALTTGVPVLASDITAFRHIEADGLTLLPPNDGKAWEEIIAVKARANRGSSRLIRPRLDNAKYFSDVQTFLEAF